MAQEQGTVSNADPANGRGMRVGLGMRHNYVLQVQGRKSGKTYSTPVNVLDHEGRLFLVAPRGETQWVRNARAQGQVKLKKGRQTEPYRVRTLTDPEKPEILRAYLDSFRRQMLVWVGPDLRKRQSQAQKGKMNCLVD